MDAGVRSAFSVKGMASSLTGLSSLFFDPPGTNVPGYYCAVPEELELTHRMSQSRRDGTIYSPARQCRVSIKGIRVPIGDDTNVALHPNSGGHGWTPFNLVPKFFLMKSTLSMN
jgi:hypothetical protein